MSEERFVFIAAMDVEPGKEELFHEVYDTEHVDAILRVPGVRSVERYEAVEGSPRWIAVYEIEHPELWNSPEFKAAADSGRWPTEVRPYTFNKSLTVYRLRSRRVPASDAL